MKRISRLTALLLALMMLLSIPVSATEGVPRDDLTRNIWDEWANDDGDGTVSPAVPGDDFGDRDPSTSPVDAPAYAVTEYVTLAQSAEGSEAEKAATLNRYGKLVLESGIESGRWQVLVSDQWINISTEASASFEVTYAKVESLLAMNGFIKVRCISADGATISETANITVSYDLPSLPAAEPQRATYGARSVAARAAATDDDPETVIVEIAYQFTTGEAVDSSYVAQISKGSDLTTAVIPLPQKEGYVASYVTPTDGATFTAPTATDPGSIQLTLQNVTADTKYVVTYVPDFVDYKVEHYLMGFDADQSTAVRQDADTKTYSNIKKTGEQVGEGVSEEEPYANSYEGYTALWFDGSTAVAADGSTVIKIYYERNWYLMLFDLDGGYGVEPIYAQYGAPVSIDTPKKAGYVFKGWEPAVPATVPAMPTGKTTYNAIWEVGDPVNYTVVYWKENADDAGYSFWGQVTRQATAETVVSGSDDIPDSITMVKIEGVDVDEKEYFTYNAAKTEQNVEVKGDGSTVVNVYYYRNTYTLYFRGISGTCAIEEHTHGTNCNSYLDCTKDEHTHGEDCVQILSCEMEEHAHTREACYNLICGKALHLDHTNDCLICTKKEHAQHNAACCSITAHTHSDACCTKKEHTHSDACCGKEEHTHSWYCRMLGCEKEEHTHSDACCGMEEHTHNNGACVCDKFDYEHVHGGSDCTCDLEIHTHSEDAGCYNDTLHAHLDECYELICDKAVHAHTTACYTYSCGGEEHTHDTDACYRPCTKCEHTHTNQCYSNRTDNVIYVITAKYDQNIGDVWPTADKFPTVTLKGWDIDGISSEAVSKRINMTSDLCDTSDNLKYAQALTGGQEQQLNYMFESFDQTSPPNGTTRILRDGIYYDRSALYSQTVNSGSSVWNLKPIYGMASVARVNADYDNNARYYKSVFLYYNRNRSNLMYHNVNGIVKTVSSIMFEQPLKDYTDSDGNLLSAYVPPYPDGLEKGAYEFEGWYTTPERYEGTKFDFATATMPNGDYTIYANWVPVIRNVRVYPSEADKTANTNQIGETIEVPHGEMVPEDKHPADPENGNYNFVGWFYRDEDGNEKAFDFENMPVRKDLDIYAKWSSNVPVPFTIYYRLAKEDGTPYTDADGEYVNVADPLVSQALPGYTVTVDAKTGSDLYADYRNGYFPKPPSHSVMIDIEAENEYTFWYTPAQKVPYRVVYLREEDDGTYGRIDGVADKLVEDNTNVVVTENYLRIPGFMPDAYQKRLIVSYPGTTDDTNGNNKTDPDLGENIIFFYYRRDIENAYWTVTHYIQPVDGSNDLTTWQQYGATESQTGKIGTEYTASQKTIPGFTYRVAYVDQYDFNGNKDETDVTTTLKAELSTGGMDFRLYYVRNEYPIKVQYLEQGTNATLADPELYNNGATYDYQSQVSVSTAKDIPGYTLVSANPQTITIQVDGDALDTIAKNVVTFYYKKTEIEINYVGVAPDGTLITTADQKASIGSVSPEAEPGTNGIVTAVDGPVAGSTATAKTNYKFVGWYLDAACTQPVPEAWVTGSTIVPRKNSTTTLYETATYYAKFDYDTSTLTITKKGMAENEAAMFTVKVGGKTYKVALNKANNFTATISGLTVGSGYTITEDGNWSWRYNATTYTYTGKDADNNPIIVAGGSKVDVTNTPKTDKWLSDEDSVINFLPQKSNPDGGEQ